MGSNRYDDPRNQTDQSQQTRDGRQVQGTDRMQSEVYGNQGRDRISQSQQMVAQELNGVLSHLQNAEMTFEQRGVRAATGEYTAAIRAADSIDQQAVARERDNVRQMLQSQNLDAQTRRALVQEDADLHTLQRAPGFARANFALLMIRNGDQYYGTQLLLEAQQKDPEMNQDPNFQRHLKNAIDSAPRGQQQQGYDQTQQQQQPYDQGQQQQQQRPGDTQQQQVPQGDQTQQQQQQRVSPLDAQNRSPVEAVQQMFSTVTGPHTMTPEVKQGFQQAIAAADAGQSPRMQQLLQAEAQAAQAVRPLADQALVQKVTAQDQAAQTLIQQMTPDKQQAAFQLYNALDKASTPQERQQIEQQLVAINPGLQQILQNRDQIMGAQNIQALMNYMNVENALQAEKNQQAITRFTYGMALAKNGDTEEAKKYIGDAVKLNNSTDPELKAFWQRTAASMGVPMDNTAPQTTTDNTQRQQQQQQGDQSAGTAAAALQAVEQKFQQVVAQKGDVKAAYQQLTPEFQAAQQKADAEFTALVQQTTARDQQLQAAIDAKLTPQVKAQLQQLGAQIDTEKAKLTPDAVALYSKYQDPSTSDADRQTIHAQLVQKAPNLAKLGDQLEQVVGKDTLMNIMTLAADHSKMQGALMGRFLTRYYLADAAATAGDTQTAQAQLGAAFQTVPAEFQQAFSQKPDVQALAQKVGIDLTKLPAPPDAVLTQAGAGTATGDQTQRQPGATTDQTQQPGAATDQTGNIAGLNPENQGLRPDQIMAKAQQALQQGGMTEATKKQFQDAIKSADTLYGPQDKQMTDQLIQVLQTGKKADGSALSPQERVQAHQLVQQEFSRATLGMQYRMAYGSALNQNKQYASAEAVFKDNITIADKLPLTAFQAELTQLGKDSQNPQIDRASQGDLFTMMQSIQGSGTSKDDGLLYMPITTRKQAALFYVAGADGSGNGLVKPEQAAAMIDQATAKEKQLYGVADDKVKAFDPTLANMAQGIIPLLPENIRKQKQASDSMWSNVLVDGGTAAVVITLAGLTASIVTKNPRIFGMLVEGEGAAAKLSMTGYAAIGTAGLGLDIAGRHYTHQLLTGENEGWDKSAIHGVAGLGAVAAIMGTRSVAGKFLFGGATSEAALTRFATSDAMMAKAADGSLIATSRVAGTELASTKTVGEFFTSMAKNGTAMTDAQKALMTSDAAIIGEGGAINAEAVAALKGLSPAQLTTLTQGFLKESGEGAKLASVKGIGSRIAGANPFSALDLTSATSGRISMRQFYSGYSTAFSGVGTFNSITALDRDIDPATGKPMSYGEQFMKNNFNGTTENILAESLMLSMMPIMKDGALAKSVLQDGAGLKGNTWNAIKSPWSATTFGSMGTDALTSSKYLRTGLQAGQMAIVTTYPSFMNVIPGQKMLTGWQQSSAYGKQLDAMGKPIQDQAAPTAAPTDTQVLNQKPAGQTDAPATQTPPQDNGQPIKDQPVDNTQQQGQTGNLTQGTPGLGG